MSPTPEPPGRAATLMTAPTLLHRRVRHQPVDGHLDAGRHPARHRPVGDAAPDLHRPRPHRRARRAGGRPARHGLRRQRRPDRQRQGRRRPLRPRRARRRIRRLRRLDVPQRLSPRRDPARQRGPGRPAGRRLDHPGRSRFPHRPPRARRDRRPRRNAGRQPGTRRPALLPPRHRAGGARRHHHRLLPAGVHRALPQRRWPSCSPTPSRWPAPTPTSSGLNVVSDGLNVVLPAAATGFAEQLRQAGFRPVGVDLSELLKGGGSVKCCTLEVHP